ncbi:baculoviral IAP repeat-containing protein 5b [Gadus morhua]|uniref:Baculoviral IAP repeat containing 5b n=1 Tax=Gadus morhua TaxID=8049 RepID=A0A8C4Z8W9_GADMO|nr:baculoviral IAP repeat-containing protein 5.1-like [Gadus morhua]
MANIEVLKERFDSFHQMYSQESRIQSFVDWPFREECMCTPEKMAMAGLVHCPSDNEPDIACCFYCLLELEGWEPDDNPRIEHINRSPNCRFLTTGKDFSELTVAEFHHMEQDRLKIYLKKVCHMKLAYLREEIDKTLDNLKSMNYHRPK